VKGKKKPAGIKHRIREKKKRERRIALAIIIAILIIIVSASGFFINSMLNKPSPDHSSNTSTSEPKAAIADHLSLTAPNQTFIQTATNTLEQAGYTVDYYPGEDITVGFYRDLPKHNYDIIILRVHSTAAELQGQEYVETPVCLFTSENYTTTKYLYEQLYDQIVGVSYTVPEPPFYFGIMPKFVTSSMSGRFQDTAIIMMGCEGLNNTKMAEAFIQKGAKVYIGWRGAVSASRTDQATAQLLQHLIMEKQTIKQAVTETMNDVGPDLIHDTVLLYDPPEAEEYVIPDVP